MESLIVIVVGVLYMTGIYLLLNRSILKIVLGISIISQGVNLMIFASAGMARFNSPIIGANEKVLDLANAVDPLPQALILTAIVISFGFLAYAIALLIKVRNTADTDDVDEVRFAE
ncbi:MAG: NADH-quinone oxidoreductase subunit K [Verrucomicrobia bacterium]|nr:NADH-quinone oxidoreductase subunit K [Verrucomicrobiota bacterium]